MTSRTTPVFDAPSARTLPHAADRGESVDPIILTLGDGVAWVTLNRPEHANAIDLALARALLRAVHRISAAAPRVVVIEGSGGNFCAGGDVREMAIAPHLGSYVRELASTFHQALADLADLDAVIIASVDGVAAGGGLGLALSADIQLASNRAMFLTAYEALGLTPDSGTSFLLPRAVGMPRARAMSAAGVRMDAAAAAAAGLVHEVVPRHNLTERVSDLADRLSKRPQSHMAATRRLYQSADPDEYRRHLEAETRAISEAATSADATRLVEELASRSARSDAARQRRAARPAA